MAIIGFLFLCCLNLVFTVGCIANFCFGGGDVGLLLTGWVSPWTKFFGICLMALCIWFWYLLYINSPIGLVVK